MESVMLRGLVTIESDPAALPSEPKKVVRRSYPGAPQQDAVELAALSRPASFPASGANSPGNSAVPSAVPSAACTPGEEQAFNFDVENSGESSPTGRRGGSIAAMQTFWAPYMNRFRFASACLISFGNGLNDAAAGALLPYMETQYNIGYALVSLIFVGTAIGFIVGAIFLDSIRARLGRSKSMALAQILITSGYIPLVCTAPFPIIVVAFFFVGFGISLNLAIMNVFCGSLANSTTALGILHGSYGVGGIVGPLLATSIVTVANSIWSRYYFITLGLGAFNVAFSTWAFVGYEKDETETQMRLAQGSADHSSSVQPATSEPESTLANTFSAFGSRVVLLGALFIFAYQGAEVSISGWVISFLITTRNGDPSKVGYVSAGFWAGITLGRFLLSGPAHRIGEKKFVYAVVVGSALFELIVWLVPNVIGNAVAVSIVGLLLGPVYPCAAAVFMRSMRRSEQVSGLGVISAFGSSGGAAAPFTTGILAQAAGTFVLHPIAIGLFGVMMVCWYGLPREQKRDE